MGKEALVVPSDILFKDCRFTGFLPVDQHDYLSVIQKHQRYAPRGEQLEHDASLQQIIPYIWIVNPDTRQVFTYRRSSGENNGESRLWNKISCALGGHIEPIDAADPIMQAMMREMREEARMESYPTPRIIGYVKLHHDVHAVHFGVVAIAETRGAISKGDDEMTSCSMCNIKELEAIFNDPANEIEEWTRVTWPIIKDYIYSLG